MAGNPAGARCAPRPARRSRSACASAAVRRAAAVRRGPGRARRGAAAGAAPLPRRRGRGAFHARGRDRRASRHDHRSQWASRSPSARRSMPCGSIRRSWPPTSSRCRAWRAPSTWIRRSWRGASAPAWIASSCTWRAACSRPTRARCASCRSPGVNLTREYRRYYPAGEVTGTSARLHRHRRHRPGRRGAGVRQLAGRRGRLEARHPGQRRQPGRGRREHSRRAPGSRPAPQHRPAHPVPGLPRAQGRDPRQSRAFGLGGGHRRAHRRSAGDGEPAGLQSE